MRPTRVRAAAAPRLLIPLLLSAHLAGCISELPALDQQRSERGSLGQEVYKVLCRRVAGTELPGDLDGRQTEALCLGDDQVAAAALEQQAEGLSPRLRALAAQRSRLVEAVDRTLPRGMGDELELFLRELLPFYDNGGPQRATRALADVLARLLSDDEALEGLARVGRDGMVPAERSYGALRAMAGYERVGQMMKVLLPILTDEPHMAAALQQALDGLALSLAGAKLDEDAEEDLRRLRELLTREHPDFAAGAPLWIAARDRRGLPVPAPLGDEAVPAPFTPGEDGLARVEKDGRFATVAGFDDGLPAPFSRLGEAPVPRDAAGRALRADGRGPLYRYIDLDRSLLRAAVAELAPVFEPEGRVAIDLAKSLPALFGDDLQASKTYGPYRYEYRASDSYGSPLVDLTYASLALVDQPIFDQGLDMSLRLLRDHEALLAPVVEGLLALDQRTRPEDDRYPDASLKEGHTFWDELLEEAEKLSRWRKVPEATLLEDLLRASVGRYVDGSGRVDERGKHAGTILATMLRYKDEFRLRVDDLNAPPVGAFATRVDRSKPDTPVTCGKDGCGGPWEGTPFAYLFEQNDPAERDPVCLIPRKGRFGADCGQPANQSLFQRSMGLVWEMAGRSQVNKPVTIRSLLEGAAFSKDPCRPDDGPALTGQACRDARQQRARDLASSVEESWSLVSQDYACHDRSWPCGAYMDEYPAAFIDRQGGGGQTAAVQPGHLFSFPDVGRVFGAAMTGDYVVNIPNPWVRRYLEDVALADRYPPCAPDFQITDPAVFPGCIVAAAKNARSLYKGPDVELPISDDVDTLDELMEYLSGVDGLTTRPTASALSRAMFAPPGSSSSLLVFNPPTLHGSPRFCSPPELEDGSLLCPADDTQPDFPGCCIDEEAPPLRHRVDTYYGGTALAWEVLFHFVDGTSLTFTEAQAPYAAAVNRHDYVAGVDDPAAFESTEYLISKLGKLVAEHWDSDQNPLASYPAAGAPPAARWFRRGTGLVKYEELLADALDDGTLVHAPDDDNLHDEPGQHPVQLGLQYHAFNLSRAILAMDFGAVGDGLDVSAELAELTLNPHARCAAGGDRRVVAGVGACQRALQGADPSLAPPLSAPPARDGTPGSPYLEQDGVLLDGREGRPLRFTSPLQLALGALGAMEDRLQADPAVEAAFRRARSRLLDRYARVDGVQLADRRLRALLLVFVDHLRERWAEERAADALPALRQDLVEDTRALVEHPVFAAGLEIVEGLEAHPEALDELTRFAYAVLDDRGQGGAPFRALITALGDFVQLLPGDAPTDALLRVMGGALSRDADRAVREAGVTIDPTQGAFWQQLSLARDAVARDDADVLQRMLNNLAAVPEGGGPSPLDALATAWTEVNRVRPGAGGVLSAADWRGAVEVMEDVLTDPRRGMERLFELVRCREADVNDLTCPGN